ncbi:TonB-dependent receptor [Aestuariicella hydrocarbonica]|uniref:TonB-dependent receptor n=1 Tax=Pseudomaricurvus hydrocarbonicus TaxID=1470433 RepID=A0A9E5MM48_9GAMM|nr:TonB-dependent receptor [Aestuariicella hydrocarbonica]NHO66278.1 TonB-dependent receptor [Aestuariicella hydrocarbonica]
MREFFCRHPLGLAVLAAGLTLGHSALAADTDVQVAKNKRAAISEEVVVTASRVERPLSTIPNTVTLIDQVDLTQQLSISNDLSSVLGNLIPSFSPSRQKMSNAGESLRGRKPLYLIDGVPQSNPLRNGGRDGHTIDPLMLERVEVIHGANAIHGMGASGGIINLITKEPTEDLQQAVRFETNLQPEDASDSLGYGASYSVSGQAAEIDFLGSVSYRSTGVSYDADGEVVGFDNTQGDTMDSDAINAFIKVGHSWGEQRVQLTVNHYNIEGNNNWLQVDGDQDAGIPTSSIEADVPGKEPSNEVTTINLQYSHEAWLGHKLRLQAFSQDFEGTYGGTPSGTFQDASIAPVGTLFDQSQNNSEKYGVKLTLIKDDVAGLPVNLVYGVDAYEDETWQALILTGRSWVPPTLYKNVAPYVQGEFTGVEKLSVTAGLRREISTLEVDDFTTLASYGSQFVQGGDIDFSETLGNIGATYQVTERWRVYANYSEGFSMPDVGRVLRGINVANQSVETFLDLEPILTENQELGVEFHGERFNAQLAYYASDSDFGQRLNRGADGIYTVNREQTEIDGVEFSSQWFATESDTLGLRVAYTKGRYDSDDDGRVDTDLDGANIAPNRVNLSWERSWGDRLSTRVQANVMLDRNFDAASGVKYAEFDGYTTFDVSAQLLALGGQFVLGIQNLTNEDYFTYYSQTVGNDARNFKGIGRSMSLSYNYQF